MVLSNALNFNYHQNGIYIQKTQRMPQEVKSFNSIRRLERNYILYSDIGNGATTFYKKSVFLKYLSEANDIIKYSEDQLLKVMIIDKMKICYLNKTTLFYEYGNGVSKNGLRLMERDSENIIKLFKKRANTFRRRMILFSLYNKGRYLERKTNLRKIFWYLSTPGLVFYTIKCKFWPVYLHDSYSDRFLLKCFHKCKGDLLCK